MTRLKAGGAWRKNSLTLPAVAPCQHNCFSLMPSWSPSVSHTHQLVHKGIHVSIWESHSCIWVCVPTSQSFFCGFIVIRHLGQISVQEFHSCSLYVVWTPLETAFFNSLFLRPQCTFRRTLIVLYLKSLFRLLSVQLGAWLGGSWLPWSAAPWVLLRVGCLVPV